MTDWTPKVRQMLELGKLPIEEKEQIIAEVIAHLEDLYEQYRMEGLDESEAAKQAFIEVKDWHGFATDIQHARRTEGNLNNRVKNLWLPGLGSIVAAQLLPKLLFIVLMRLGVSFSALGTRGTFFIALAVMIVSGALGAFLSMIAGGDLRDRLLSALFPVIVLAVAAFGPGVPNWLLIWIPSLAAQLSRTPVLALVDGFTVLIYAATLCVGAWSFLGSGTRLRQRSAGRFRFGSR